MDKKYEMTEWKAKAKKAYDDAGVSIEDYIFLRNAVSNLESDKDKNGNTISGSLKEKVLEEIDSMKLSKKQKDSLYLNNPKGNYSEKELKNAPWH